MTAGDRGPGGGAPDAATVRVRVRFSVMAAFSWMYPPPGPAGQALAPPAGRA